MCGMMRSRRGRLKVKEETLQKRVGAKKAQREEELQRAISKSNFKRKKAKRKLKHTIYGRT